MGATIGAPMKRAIKKIHEIAYHRNGISGTGFHVIRFRSAEGNEMVGIVFPEEGAVAVLDIAMLADGNIAFARGNSWRGDNFADDLRNAISEAEKNDT